MLKFQPTLTSQRMRGVSNHSLHILKYCLPPTLRRSYYDSQAHGYYFANFPSHPFGSVSGDENLSRLQTPLPQCARARLVHWYCTSDPMEGVTSHLKLPAPVYDLESCCSIYHHEPTVPHSGFLPTNYTLAAFYGLLMRP